ncbi:SH3 domain-containing protein, partial [Candidatus Gottesmanbacteria bacterium]|nr:SH3 domain-containing protein [Candidatus Gottesmanbacteria bacterium]
IDLDPTGTTTGNIIDIDTSTAHSGHVLSIDNTGNAVWTGNIIDVATGTGDASGDVLKVAIEAGATDTQTIVVTNAAASDQAGWLLNVAASGIYTSDVISFDNTGNTASSGDFISFTTGTGDADGDVADITLEAGATSTQIFDVNNAAVSDEAGWLMEVDTTGAWTGNMIDIALGAQLSTGDIMNVSMGSTNVGGGVLVVADAGGARTDAIIDITTASTGSAADAAAIFQINSTGDLDDLANVLDINRSGGAGSNVIDITTLTTASAGNLIDLNFGAITDTGDAINIALGATATGSQAMVVSSGVMTRTTDLISITDSGTSSGDTIEIALTGATTGHGIFLNNDAMVATGNVLYIDSDADRSSTSLFVIDDIADDTASAPTVDINLTAASDQPIINIDTAASNGSVIDLNHTLADVTVQTYLIRGTYSDTADAEADFLLFEDAAGTAQFLIAEDGNTTITGTGDGTAALTLTTGDLTLSDGDLTVSGGDVNFTTDAGDTLNIAKGAAPTADVVLIAAGSPTTTNVDALAITMTTTDQTDITNSLMNLVLTSGGTAATDIARGIFIDLASTAGGNDTAIEIENTAAWDVDIALQFDETINNATDDSVTFSGVGGTNNETFTIDLDSVASSGTTLSSGGSYVLINDNLSVGIDGNTTENIASSDFAFSGNDLYVDDKLGVNGTLSVDGNLWQGDAVTTTSKTASFLFLGTTAGAPTGDPSTPAGFAAIVYDTTNNKLCAEEEAAGAAWLCTGALVDVAEWMPARGAEPGDLVSLTNELNPVDDPTAPFMLGKTAKAYDNKLVGVISKYAEDAESALGYKRSADYHAVTLVGRVPVKVSGDNGPISRGDYLTSSGTAGYAIKATKAGPVAGMALENFSGDKGTITLFVKATYYDPRVEEQQEILAALTGTGDVLGTSTVNPAILLPENINTSTLAVAELAEFKGNLTVTGLAEFKGNLSVAQDLTVGGNLEVGGAVVITTTAGEALKAGEAVYIASSGVVKKASNTDESRAQVLGLVTQAAAENGQVQIAVAGKVSGLSGLEVGKRYFLGTDGKLVTSVSNDAKKLVQVGLALTENQLVLQILLDTKLEAVAPSPTAQATVQASPTPQPSITAAVVDSSPSPSATPAASPSVSISPTITLTIKDTELGFLRVRGEPATSAPEVGQVSPGQTFTLQGEQDGWYKIEYTSGKTGWVSASYVTVTP